MSDTLSLYPRDNASFADLTTKTDDLLRPIGGGYYPDKTDATFLTDNTRSTHQTLLQPGISSRIENRLATSLAQNQIGKALADHNASTKAPSLTTGLEAQTIARRQAETSPQVIDHSTGLPKLQFLSHDTALKTTKPKSTNSTAAITTRSDAPHDRTTNTPGLMECSYDIPAYAYTVNNAYGGTDSLSFTDNFNRILPGVAVNTSYDDIGERRDGAWQQPGMHAYPSSDSGNRADQVQNYFLSNADTIGRNILGTPIPPDRIHNLRDFIHGEIKQHHHGNQETISEVLHLLATQDNQTSTQLNNIWHATLGRAISPDELGNAISQISIGHATLQTERWTVSHSQEAANHLREIISAVQNRPVNPGDETWVQWQQDTMGRSEQTLIQVRQSLAHWTANDGQYDQVFRDVHGRDPGPQDREYAGNMIGNGWSVQDYRWNEAHSDTVSISITERMRNDEYFNNSSINLNNDIVKLQDDLGRGKITYQRIMSLIDLGAKLSSIDDNTGSGKYTPVSGHSPDSYLYTDGSGRQFWVTSRYSFSDIANDAKNAPSYAHPSDLQNSILYSIGHGGKFDAQRDPAAHVLFQGNIDNANYNVGIWCAAYGMTEAEMHLFGISYIVKHSENSSDAFSTYARDAPLWEQGYIDYSTGRINK